MKKFLIYFLLTAVVFTGICQNNFKPTAEYTLLSAKAFQLYNQGKYLQSALTYDTLFRIAKGNGSASDRYNAACSWALAGSIEKSFFNLDRAVKIGKWSNLDHALKDGDLTTLHKDDRWKSLMKEIEFNRKVKEDKLNKPLVALLDTVHKEDQEYRLQADSIGNKYGWQSTEMQTLWKIIEQKDAINLIKVKDILNKYGWLGAEEVGDQGSTTIFLVIQHSDSLTQVTYLPLMRAAVKKGKARPQELALLEDRVLMKQGKEQIYGSQVISDSTGKNQFYKIRDEPNVNKRRASVGLGTLEEYAKHFKMEYTLPPPVPANLIKGNKH